MLLSFAVFCAILITVIVGIQYFLFQSRIPLQSLISVPRGTATLVDSDLNQTAVTKSDEMFYGSVLTTDTQSQASISFVDPQHENRLIASVTIENGSGLNLKQDSRPRFEFSSDAPYWIDFKDVYGEFDVFIPDNITHPILIGFATTLGQSARLTSSGHNTLIASGQQVQVINYAGDELLLTSDLRAQIVPAGHMGSLTSADQFALAENPDPLGDAFFSKDNVIDIDTTSEQVQAPLAWVCNNMEADPSEAMGSVGLTDVDGRLALRLFRGNGADSHGRTMCWHGLGTSTDGLDVSQFSSVSIRATFKITSQSLSACGIDASECPLMLVMDYIPVNDGEPKTWVHGFYAFADPSRLYPSQCDTCSEQHEAISPDTWYTYESHNLFETFLPGTAPKSILNLRFYASGHQYEVYVSQVVLLADQTVIADGS